MNLKKLTTPLFILVLVLPVAATAASFSLFGSYYDPDAVDDAFGGGIAVSFPLGTSSASFDIRATYLEELSDDPLDALFDTNDSPVFEPNSIEILPIDIGVRWNILPRESVNPYIGAGGTYVLLDSKRPGIELDDEFGYYGIFGARFGDNVGPGFFAEVLYRKIEGTAVRNGIDDDIGNTDFVDEVAIDIDGFAANAGIRWSW